MIEIRNVQTPEGQRINHSIVSHTTRVIEADELVLFPGLIDPHVHFRVPGGEHKETWETGAAAAIAGGITTVLDMPNNHPSCISKERLEKKKQLIDEQLKKAKIPLRYGLYLGADQNHLDEIGKTKNEIVGLKIYMGSSTGDLLMKDSDALSRAFEIAAKESVLVAVHAEDEDLIEKRKKQFAGESDPSVHSVIRNPEVAVKAVAQAIELARKYGTRLYLAHVSTKDELQLIRAAKKQRLPVYAEVTPHHLFLESSAYAALGTRALVNPPLRSKKDCEALWDAISDGTIDTVGSDHAPHTLEEKNRPYGAAPSGFASVELTLPLLLNAFHEKRISLGKIVSLMCTRPREIFGIPQNDDVVLIDLKKKKRVEEKKLHTKAKWSPFAGFTLQGWPRYTILKSKVFGPYDS